MATPPLDPSRCIGQGVHAPEAQPIVAFAASLTAFATLDSMQNAALPPLRGVFSISETGAKQILKEES